MSASAYARRYLVRFEPLGRSVSVSPGTTLLDAAQLLDVGTEAARALIRILRKKIKKT